MSITFDKYTTNWDYLLFFRTIFLPFEYKGKKYILVATDFFGDYDFDVFPHLLKYESDRLEFVLQREVSVKDEELRKKLPVLSYLNMTKIVGTTITGLTSATENAS